MPQLFTLWTYYSVTHRRGAEKAEIGDKMEKQITLSGPRLHEQAILANAINSPSVRPCHSILGPPDYFHEARKAKNCIKGDTMGRRSVSVFQVGSISFSVYWSVFFQVGSILVVGFPNIAISVRYFTLCQSATCGSQNFASESVRGY